MMPGLPFGRVVAAHRAATNPVLCASLSFASTSELVERVEGGASLPDTMRARDIGSRLIVAVARNYASHVAELNNTTLTTPVIFLKPPSSRIFAGDSIRIPRHLKEVHHEVELGVVIGDGPVSCISPDRAMDYIHGYVLALDLTARELQRDAAKNGLPWTTAKGFDTFCPISELIPANQIPDPMSVDLELKVNGNARQKGSTSQMLFDIPTLIAHCSHIMTLNKGDLILTGTPSGVGPLKRGDSVEAELKGYTNMIFPVQ